jgi:hypothetical protein
LTLAQLNPKTVANATPAVTRRDARGRSLRIIVVLL